MLQIRRVLFSRKEDWIKPILRYLDAVRFQATFADFETIDFTNYDMVVPLTLTDITWLRRNDPSGVGIRHILPSESVVALCNDKLMFSLFLEDNGFTGISPKLVADTAFPCVLRKRHGEWGMGIYILHSLNDVKACGITSDADEYFFQEYVHGCVEYTTHYLFSEGVVHFENTIAFKFDMPFYVKGYQCSASEIAKMDTVPGYSVLRSILRELKFNGICCFNYKMRQEVPCVFELNLRFGASLSIYINQFLEVYASACSK